MQRSIDIAINVFTDAETDTPCMYDTVLHMKVPNVHSKLNQFKRLSRNSQCGFTNNLINIPID